MDDKTHTARIRALNDTFRENLRGGKIMVTSGVRSEGTMFMNAAIAAVRSFNDFDPGNDPYQEHDFGSVEINGEKLFWKIDYYAAGNMNMGSEDPSDAAMTARVMTIMLASEY